jgi:hypothetical protein
LWQAAPDAWCLTPGKAAAVVGEVTTGMSAPRRRNSIPIHAAHHALNQQDKLVHRNWALTKEIGAGLVEVRRLAMSRAMTNRPYGRAYTAAHAQLLEASKLDLRIKDKGDRQKTH